MLFALNSNADFLTGAVNFGGTIAERRPVVIDLDTGMAASLNRANRLDASGLVYLPHGDGDAHNNFVPNGQSNRSRRIFLGLLFQPP